MLTVFVALGKVGASEAEPLGALWSGGGRVRGESDGHISAKTMITDLTSAVLAYLSLYR